MNYDKTNILLHLILSDSNINLPTSSQLTFTFTINDLLSTTVNGTKVNIPFTQVPMKMYTEEDYNECRPEDEKMMELLINNNVRVMCNKEVTVKYYLGGYSNETDDPIESTVQWEK